MNHAFPSWAKRFFFVAASVCVAGIVIAQSISDTFLGKPFRWNQRITVQIDTPDGLVEASSVQTMEVRYFPDGVALSGNEVTRDLWGEAVVADLGEGRFLFVLLGPKNLAERTYYDRETKPKREEVLKYIKQQRDKGPRSLPPPWPRGPWPQMVSFADVSDPSTVIEVDPTDLAATFGEGYELLDLTIEATWDGPTEGRVEAVLPWWREYFSNQFRLNGERCIACPKDRTLAAMSGPGQFKVVESK